MHVRCGEPVLLELQRVFLVCELCKKNILVFGTGGASAQFLGSVTGHCTKPAVLVALHVGQHGRRVRSHFQRLIPAGDVLEVKRQAVEERLRRDRETSTMADEGELARWFTQRLKEEARQMECEN